MASEYAVDDSSVSAADAVVTVTPALRADSPPPDVCPVPAMNACPELSRCLSTASSLSVVSGSDIMSRESLGSDAFSRRSSGSYNSSRMSDISQTSSRHSTYSLEGVRFRRRGYVRPQGTDFAASARSRESVLSLGSIAHLQYYFARTGLLDGKGAQLARKKAQKGQKDAVSPIESLMSPKIVAVDYDSDMGIGPHSLVESPIHDDDDDDYFSDDLSDTDAASMLPPTVSTYNHRMKAVPPPPTVEELKEQLTTSLNNLTKSLSDARALVDGDHDQQVWQQRNPAWFEHQGFHMLDVATLAIRAAKVYYTAHEQPERLAALKSERELRAELLAAMEVLQRMAARSFVGGMRAEEIAKVELWIDSVHDLLQKDDQADASDRAERANWLWAKPEWHSDEIQRELAFMESMMDLEVDEPLPTWSSVQDAAELPTPFLSGFRNGLRLVKLHNAAVRKSRRRFGAIPMYHTDTMKPYRCADNLRYWVKAAELRWEVKLKIDPLGIVYNSSPEAWAEFEAAILKWCRGVRAEITGELED